MKALEIKASMVFKQNYLIMFLFFLIIDLYFLISAVIAQIFIPTAEIAISNGIPTKEAKAEIGTHPLTVKAK